MIAPEVNYFRTFSVLFFPVTVIWRETRHSGCVNGSLSPSTFLLCKQQQLDDLFSEFSVPTGGLSTKLYFLSSRFRTTFWSWTTSEAVLLSPCFHFQINKIFLSCIWTRTTLNLCKNNYSKKTKAASRGYFWLHGDGHKREIQSPPPQHCTPLFHILPMERPSQPFLLHFPRFIDAARWTGTFQLPPHHLIIPPEISSLYLLDK